MGTSSSPATPERFIRLPNCDALRELQREPVAERRKERGVVTKESAAKSSVRGVRSRMMSPPTKTPTPTSSSATSVTAAFFARSTVRRLDRREHDRAQPRPVVAEEVRRERRDEHEDVDHAEDRARPLGVRRADPPRAAGGRPRRRPILKTIVSATAIIAMTRNCAFLSA